MKRLLLLFTVSACMTAAPTLARTDDAQQPRTQQAAYVLNTRIQNKIQSQNNGFGGFSYSAEVASVSVLQTVAAADIPAVKITGKNPVPEHFTLLGMEGYASNLDEIGAPSLPVKVEMIELPQGATAKIIIDQAEYQDIDLKQAGYPYPLMPVQAPRSKSQKEAVELAYDAWAYAERDFNTKPLVQIEYQGQMRHIRLAKMWVRPFNYNPATHTLRVYTTLRFHVEFEGADQGATYHMRRVYGSPAFSAVENRLLNPLPALQGKAAAYEQPIGCVIVSDPMFQEILQPFIEWKTKFGYKITEAYVGEEAVGSSKESILAYLKGLYENATEDHPAPAYAIFVGDLAQVPTKEYIGSSYWIDDHYSDLYLAEYTGDRFPDIMYGRMSATNVAQLQPQIDKILYMEGISYDKTSFLDTAVIIAGIDDSHGNSHLNPTVEYIYNLYLKDTLTRHTYRYNYPSSSSASNDIIANINAGISLAIYTAHGDWDEWYEPNISNSDVNNKFKNKDKYPLLVGNCCLTGKFDEGSCFGETLLRKKDAGAAVYIGCSNSSYFDEDVYWAIGNTTLPLTSNSVHTYANTTLGSNDAAFHTHGEEYAKWALNASEMIYAGNMAVEESGSSMTDYYWQIYHVFGDPTYQPYLHRPVQIEAEYQPMIVLGTDEFEVNTWPYARVTLSRDGVVYGVATASAEGTAVVNVESVIEPGMYTLTVYAQNGLPLIEEVAAAVPSDKYVLPAKEYMITASADTLTAMEYNADLKLGYLLRSLGKQAVANVKMVLTIDDPYVSVVGGNEKEITFPAALAPGEEYFAAGVFNLKVSPSIPDGHDVVYSVSVISDGDAATVSNMSYKRKGRSAMMELVSFTLDDSKASNPNGILDPGEQATLVVKMKNTGSCAARDLAVSATSSEGYAIVETTEPIRIDKVEADAVIECRFTLRSPEMNIVMCTYDITVSATGNGRTDQMVYSSYAGTATETFESGDFTYVDWENASGGSTPWIIDATHVYAGQNAAASGSISDGGKSAFSLRVEMPRDDEISFWYYVSSEKITATMGDFFNFYIDGTRMLHVGGDEKTWKRVSFIMRAGTHVIKFEYAKDGSTSTGEDRVWVDNIKLPFGTSVAGAANEGGAALSSGASVVKGLFVQGDELHLKLQSTSPVSGSLYVADVLGRKVAVLERSLRIEPAAREAVYPLASLRRGLYLLVFEAADGRRQTQKFIK